MTDKLGVNQKISSAFEWKDFEEEFNIPFRLNTHVHCEISGVNFSTLASIILRDAGSQPIVKL